MERLNYFRIDDEETLIFQLSLGGGSARFAKNMPAEEVVQNLRILAERLERGVESRSKG